MIVWYVDGARFTTPPPVLKPRIAYLSYVWSSCAFFRAGTPLRGVFKSARLRLDDASAELRSMNVAREKNMTERMEEIVKKRKAQFERFDQSGSEDVHGVGIVEGGAGAGER